jgi:FkbM family methyltransferase
VIKRLSLIVLALAIAVPSLALKFYPPAAGWLLIMTGKSPACGVSAYGAMRRYFAYDTALSHISQNTRRVREDGNLKLTESPHGQYWEPAGDDSIVIAQLAELDSKYDHGKAHPVRPGDTVIDCGANVGTRTISALRAGAKLVVAVEPDPVHIECLRRNLRRDIDAGRVVLIPKGVWSKEDTLVLRQSGETSAKNSFVETAGTRAGLTLPVTTIDTIVRQLGLQRVDFIKMDIEGSEPKALAGAWSTLARWHPRMELEVSDGNQAELLTVARQGWSGYRADCLVCFANSQLQQIVPSLVSLR